MLVFVKFSFRDKVVTCDEASRQNASEQIDPEQDNIWLEDLEP